MAAHNFNAQLTNYQDLAGNSGGSGFINFTTSSVTDTVPPAVRTSSPLNNLSNMPANAVMHVLFTEPLQPGSLSQVQVTEGGSPLTIAASLSQGNQVLTLTPNALLAPNTSHTISIAGVKDIESNTMVGTTTINFTTGPGIVLNPNLAAPAFSPTNNSTGQSVNVQPTLTYSQPIDPIIAFTGACN